MLDRSTLVQFGYSDGPAHIVRKVMALFNQGCGCCIVWF